ncbi:MAG TPA: ATPase, T2SS/T4P/T4SS family [Candidatus Saccharimonadales bacterium]|nr:ATPase, T2SS/T4P/T4SS family [Candidatus Saccharimonadales bacterium]
MGAKDLFTGRLLGNAQKFTDKQVAETLVMLVQHGVARGASDIHIEPHERFVLVRYRIDGALHGVHKLPRPALPAILAQLKALAGLQVDETAAPQEGGYALDVNGKRVDVRVSTMPVISGEKVVLHLGLEQGKPLPLEGLGFWGAGLEVLQTVLARPHGLVVVAAPRHGGRSSTLFSLLVALNNPLVSIATVEAHPKYRLAGINQTYLSGGMAPHTSLLAALKQDPNIVMVSDVPDSATAGLAVHAATTGHLLLAGVHADGAITAVLRLRAAGVEPFLLATAFKAAVGQRLVRTLCPDCRERYNLSKEEQAELSLRFGIATAAAFKRVHELERSVAPGIFGDVKQLSSTPSAITSLWRASSTGCDTCERTGYNGRTAITEVLPANAALQKALLARDTPSISELQAIAVKEGFVPMALDGLVKALRGETTIGEVLHAVAPDAA